VAVGAPSTSGRPRVPSRRRRPQALRVDLVHYPLTVPVPLTRRPRVVTLHDVLHLDYPSSSRRVSVPSAAPRYDLAGSDPTG
jgi:hypothetical protein